MKTNTINIEHLAAWIDTLIEYAKNDTAISASWFGGTKNAEFSIVGGWLEGFSAEYSDIMYISRSRPDRAMCVKIIVNNRSDSRFSILPMPVGADGSIENTCIAINIDEDVFGMAQFFAGEWERITRELGGREDAR
jgi:hypothetical protein